MASRRALVIAGALVCFSVGFYAGNRRASALERYLDQVVLENDGLRAVMAEQVYHLDRLTDARTAGGIEEVERTRVQLDQAMLSLAEARSATDVKAREIEARDAALAEKDGALRDCASVQVKLQEQLEECIFDKAALERRAAATRGDEDRPRSGVSAFSETVTYPVPSGAKRP